MLLEVKHLKKSFELATPLTDVNCVVNKGDVIAVIGPSGCGKSTFINCLNRLVEPTEGQIFFNGEEITGNSNLPKIRTKMGMVFQSFNLFAHLTVLENIMYAPINLLKKDRVEAYHQAMELLDMVGLASKADRYPDELSGGQQQRVAICRSLAMNPEILLLDEPTSALDPTMVGDVELVIKRLAETGLTMIIVTHEMKFARTVANRIFFMNEGVIYEEGSPEEIFEHPKKQKTQWFIQRLKVFEEILNPNEFDSYEFQRDLLNFARTQMMSPRALYKLQIVFDEYMVANLFPLLKENKLTVNLAYNDETDTTELSLIYNCPNLELRLSELNDISVKMLKLAVSEDEFEFSHQDDRTVLTMTVGGEE